MLARLSFPIHDVSGGDASSMVWAFYVQVAVPMRLPDAGPLPGSNLPHAGFGPTSVFATFRELSSKDQ